MGKKTGDVVRSPIHIGHIYGYEHRRLRRAAQELGMTQKQFNDYVNARGQSGQLFRLEHGPDNVSHKFEKPGVDGLKEIKEDMSIFLSEGK